MQIKRVQQDRHSINIKKRKNNKRKINQQKGQSFDIEIKRDSRIGQLIVIEIKEEIGVEQSIRVKIKRIVGNNN